jgi:hypothetical protein
MKPVLLLLLLSLVPFSLFAADEPARNPFPDDYTPSPCAPANGCDSFAESEIASAAARFLGIEMDVRWVQDHYEEFRKAIGPVCAKQATCLATPGNNRLFCNDLTAPMLRDVCLTKYSKDKQPGEFEQCRQFMEIYALGIDQRSKKASLDAQKCAGPLVKHEKAPIVWMQPEKLPADYKGWVTFYALDPDTHVPVPAKITFEGQIVYASANPTGETATYYPFKLPFVLIEAPRKDGHRDLVPPMVTVTPENYPTAQFRLNIEPRKLVVEMNPPASKLKRGEKVTVSAKDAATGKPVELRVFAGQQMVGDTNLPIVIDWPKNKKRPEIWARSLFNRYSDVVVAPAQK